MAGNTGAPSSLTMLRWTTLVVVAANIAFVADYGTLGESPTITEVVAEYGNMFVPIGFAKTICVAILVAFLFFYFDALWPRKHRIRVYDKLVIPLALTSVLASSWIVAFRQKEIGLCAALIAASVALGGVMFVRVASVSPSQHSGWLRVPFSLHFGAMTIALLVAVSQWLNASGLLTGTAVVPDDVATLFLVITAATGGIVALRYSDFVYPSVIASGAGAIFISQRTYNPHVAADALIVCIGMLVIIVLAAVALIQQSRREPKGVASGRRTRVARRAQDEAWYVIEASSSIMRL
jgi:benzodiazapine receptor